MNNKTSLTRTRKPPTRQPTETPGCMFLGAYFSETQTRILLFIARLDSIQIELTHRVPSPLLHRVVASTERGTGCTNCWPTENVTYLLRPCCEHVTWHRYFTLKADYFLGMEKSCAGFDVSFIRQKTTDWLGRHLSQTCQHDGRHVQEIRHNDRTWRMTLLSLSGAIIVSDCFNKIAFGIHICIITGLDKARSGLCNN